MHPRRGFTLIEMLVVLVLLGLTSALVLPKFPALYDKFKRNAEQEQFFQSLGLLPLQAYTQARSISLNQTSAHKLLALSDDWEITMASPIVYRANGVCLGGELSYAHGGERHSVELLAPYCDPKAL